MHEDKTLQSVYHMQMFRTIVYKKLACSPWKNP